MDLVYNALIVVINIGIIAGSITDKVISVSHRNLNLSL